MTQNFMLGWEEWLALPDLGLPAIKAKIDTGARTSALHAFTIEPFGAVDRPKVRFVVHPVPGRDDVAITCVADVIDRREVASSNGEREQRYVITTTCAIGGRRWPIEVTLTNRETMAYRMLLGRQALQDDMFVDAQASFRQPKLSYRIYGAGSRPRDTLRRLAIALMTQRPESPSSRRLVRAAERRGHAVTLVDRTRLSLYIDTREPAVFLDGRILSAIDAVLVRGGRAAGAFTLAALRQLERQGAYVINPADALARLADPLATRQELARAGVTIPSIAVSHADLIRKARPDEHVAADQLALLGSGTLMRFAVVAGRALAAIEREAATALDEEPDWRQIIGDLPGLGAARAAAEAAARAMSLGLASVDVGLTRQGPVVIDISANVALAQIDRLAGTSLAEAIVVHLEQEARGRPARG